METVRRRSGGQCEAMVEVTVDDVLGDTHATWTRCGRSPVEVHHRLTRARGGHLLDKSGETYHLLALCPTHHRAADGQLAYAGGLLLAGSVQHYRGVIYYEGPDPYLQDKYPKPGGVMEPVCEVCDRDLVNIERFGETAPIYDYEETGRWICESCLEEEEL